MYETPMEAVVADENYRPALEAVERNQGAAGIDRMTTERLEPHLPRQSCAPQIALFSALHKNRADLAMQDAVAENCN
jgi:hypothetical protein